MSTNRALCSPTLALARNTFKTDSSIRASEISPARTASSKPWYVPFRSEGSSNMSLPALNASTAARPDAAGPPCGYSRVRAPISRASVTTRPLNPSSCFNNPSMMASEVVATLAASGSSAGAVMWATMIESTPAEIAERKGSRSICSIWSRVRLTAASPR